MKIEFLYFRECPAYETALDLLEKLVAEGKLAAAIKKIEITDQETAERHRFLGSPSIRVNGFDIEGPEDEQSYGLKCRIYSDTGSGVPSERIIQKALQEGAESP